MSEFKHKGDHGLCEDFLVTLPLFSVISHILTGEGVFEFKHKGATWMDHGLWGLLKFVLNKINSR